MKKIFTLFVFVVAVSVNFAQNAPTFVSFGVDQTQGCSGQYLSIAYDAIVEDIDGETVSLSVSSSNSAVIDPANVTFWSNPSGLQTYFYVSATASTVTAPANVVITLSFTAGADVISHNYPITINPISAVNFTQSSYTICDNLGNFNMNPLVDQTGCNFYVPSFESSYPDGIIDVSSYAGYVFTVEANYTNQYGCTSVGMADFNIVSSPQVTLIETDATNCTGTDGQIEAQITGGLTPYNLVWENGNTVDVIRTGLSAGFYHLDLVDANGCFAQAGKDISSQGVDISGAITNVGCSGELTGAIDLSVIGMNGPTTYLWSSGHSTEDLTNVVAGTYTVQVSDANGCVLYETFTISQNPPLGLDYYSSGSSCNSMNGSVYVYPYGGDGVYTYLWNNLTTDYFISNVPAGQYSCTVTDGAGCTATITSFVSDYDGPWSYPSIVQNPTCGNNTGAITMDTIWAGTNVQFVWSTGSQNLALTDLNAGTYYFHIYNAEGCDYYNEITLTTEAPLLQPICVVSVDSATTTNLVVWDKVETQAISHYNIYRETAFANDYLLIDTVQGSNISLFNDVVASPAMQSWSYKIAAVNECGQEGPMSSPHKTIHVTVIDQGNGYFKAVWNHYLGLSFNAYKIYRYNDVDGWVLIDNVVSSINEYTDQPLITSGLDYMIEFDLAASCTADYEKAQDFNTTRSNRDKGAFSVGNGTGDSNNGLIENSTVISVYPNPVNDELTIEAIGYTNNVDVMVVSLDGVVLLSQPLNQVKTTLDLSSLSAGYYFVKTSNGQEVTPIVKQ